jgi:O-antigen ligase
MTADVNAKRMVWFWSLLTLLAIFIFLIPSNLFFKFAENLADSYVQGLQVDYLLPKLYIQDLIMLSWLLVYWVYLGGWFLFCRTPQAPQTWKQSLKNLLNNVKLKLGKRFALSPAIWLTVGLCFILIIKQFFTARPSASLWFSLRLILLLLFTTSVTTWLQQLIPRPDNATGVNPRYRQIKKIVVGALLASLIFQTGLAWYQFSQQASLAGYWLLGEPNLEQALSISTGSFGGRELILPYGTTAHPNLLAGWAVINWWLLLVLLKPAALLKLEIKKQGLPTTLWSLLISLATTCLLSILLLTQSISACLAASLGLTLFVLRWLWTSWTNAEAKDAPKKWWPALLKPILLLLAALIVVLTPLLIKTVNQRLNARHQHHQAINNHARTSNRASSGLRTPSITRRQRLNQAAWHMIEQYPWLGVGLNNFTVYLEKIDGLSNELAREIVRFVQPAHHVILLWWAETGAVGMLLLMVSLAWVVRPSWRQRQRQTSIKFKQNLLSQSLLVLSPLLALDHYLLTLASGQLLLALVVVVSALEKSSCEV